MKKLVAAIYLLFAFVTTVIAQGAKLQDDLALKYLVQPPAQKSLHVPVIILLHGYGSDENDLFALRNFFPKNYLVIAARAPYALPNGGYQWYESETIDGHRSGKRLQLNQSNKTIQQFIDQIVIKYRIDPKQVYLAGFSQGAIMSYITGLSAPAKLKGIAILSGTIFDAQKLLIKKSPALKQLKIFVSHGTADERIPFAEGKAAVDYLHSLGLNPDFHQYKGMGHTISNDVLADLVKWLQ